MLIGAEKILRINTILIKKFAISDMLDQKEFIIFMGCHNSMQLSHELIKIIMLLSLTTLENINIYLKNTLYHRPFYKKYF